MTTSQLSRPTNLQDLLTIVSKTDMPQSLRRDMRSAINTIAKSLGRLPLEIEADIAKLNKKLQQISPEVLGLSKSRWANCRSLLLKALSLTTQTMPGRRTTKLSDGWQSLLDKIENQNERFRLSAPMRYLSELGINPDQLEARHLYEYRDRLLADSLRINPKNTWHSFLWQWNKCARTIPNFPAIILEKESHKTTVTYPWTKFSTSLQKDVIVWLDYLEGKDISNSPAFAVTKSTRDTREYQIRYFCSALIDAGRDVEQLNSLADIVDINNFKIGLRYIYNRKGNKRTSSLAQIGHALKSIARHHVLKGKNENDVLTHIKKMNELINRIDNPNRGITDKNLDRLTQIEDDEKVDKLINLPKNIRQEMIKKKYPRLQEECLADVALAIEFLIITNIRMNNLCSIQLDKNLISYGSFYILKFSENEVKNKKRLEFKLSKETSELINWYLNKIRPSRIKGQTDYLFIGEDGINAKAKNTLSFQIKKKIKEKVGITFNPHLFRHAMAFLYLKDHPGAYGVIKNMLGHKSLETTTNSYAGAEVKSDQAHFDGFINKLRARKKG